MDLRKIFLLTVASFTVSLASYFAFNRFILKGGAGSAALAINSPSGSLAVTVDGEVSGKTPFYSDTMKEGESSIVLSNDSSNYRGKVTLTNGTLTVVNYSLGPSEDFSDGETIWLSKSKDAQSLVIISDPDEAEVRLDDVSLGVTPISSKKITAGDHALKISKNGYRPRLIKIQNQPGYSLNIKARLFLLPVSAGAGKLEFADDSRFKITNFSTANAVLYADTSSWAKGISFYLLSPDSDSGVTAATYDLFLDYRGQLFDKEGVKVASPNITGKEEIKVGYLGKVTDGGLTDDAKLSLTNLVGKALPKVEKIQVAGNAWANVRSGPSTSSSLLIRVNEGDKFTLISEEGSFYKISLPDGKTGYISKTYARKL